MTLEPHHPSQLTHLILITSFISSSTAHVFIHHPSTVMFSCRPSYNVLKCVINISHKVSFVCLHQLSCHSCHSPCSFLNCLSSVCPIFSSCPIFHPFIKCFTHLYPLHHHLYDVHSMFSWCDWFSMFAVSIAQIFLLVLLKHQAQLEKYLKLIVSCPDGKPSEEAPKGRGRGFGGMKWIQRDIECTNSVAVCAQ